MGNRDLEASWAYHNGTKHSPESLRSSRHYLDWPNQPLPFKVYTTLPPIPLPVESVPPPVPALGAVVDPRPEACLDRAPDLRTLATLFGLSAGITKRRTFPGGAFHFRAAACTGALYHIELYLVCGELPDLPAGVYHFGVHDFALRRLRPGDFREILVRATGGEPHVAASPAVVILTTTYWRNAWKYQARAYRHAFWDGGTILANLLAVAAAQALAARLVCGFADAEVNRLLDVNPEREAAIALVCLGRGMKISLRDSPEAGPLELPTERLSPREVDYPAIRMMHAASSLVSEEVSTWRGSPPAWAPPKPAGRMHALRPRGETDLPADSIENVIRRRGSTRVFAREPLRLQQLSTLLERATRDIPADFLGEPGSTLNRLYLIVHAVEGLPSGAYVFHREPLSLEMLKEGNFRREAGYLGLEQELPADASVNVYFLADLPPILERFGNRGYRAAQLEAAIRAGKLYLAAYAQGLGATGLTFYDDEVTNFFSPHAAPKEPGIHGDAVGARPAGGSVMFLVALGLAARRHPSRRR
jgi:SagB-type dehydrogenase family enzyme